MENGKKKKKGLFSVIRESLTKTGGCCGPGETCGGASKKDDKETLKNIRGSDKEDNK